MKSKKIFEISYILNFILSFFLICEGISFSFEKKNPGEFSIAMIFLALFLVIIVPFNWACYSLIRKYKLSEQLSKKGKVFGAITYILFAILTVLLIAGSVSLIYRGLDKNIYHTLYTVSFLCMTVTAIYLCILYWIIRKKTKSDVLNNDVLSQLGTESEN